MLTQKELADKLRKLRIKSGMSQEELSMKATLPKGFISQIERAQVSPPVSMLLKLLEALEVSPQEFFSDSKPHDDIVLREEDMPVTSDDELGFTLLKITPPSDHNVMDAALLTLEPGGTSRVYEPSDCEEFGLVIKGTVNLNIGTDVFKVRKGDSFYFRPAASHFISNTGSGSARLVWLSTVAMF